MNGRFTALLLSSTLLLYGCAAEHVASFSAPSSRSSAEADTREGVERHFDRLFAQLHRLEQLEHRKQPGVSQSSRSIRGMRPFYAAYRQIYLSDGAAVHDRNYYRLQHRILDSFSAQLLQFEQLLTQHPNVRNA